MFSKYFTAFWLAIMAAILSACATAPQKQYQDPFESFNRKVYGFNDGIDRAVILPVTKGYKFVTPDLLEEGVGNFFDNLAYPSVAVNQFLQGKPVAELSDVGRFGVNSTLGIAGLFDVASGMGLKKRNEDFGQTFARWGFGSGPYIVMPLRGGGTLRDIIGGSFDGGMNPAVYINDNNARIGLAVLGLVDTSAGLIEARELIQGDGYLFVKDAYAQRREFLITDGAQAEDDPFLDD